MEHWQHNVTTLDQILRKALAKETQARDFYAKLALACPVNFVIELLEKLGDEEGKHMHMIQEMRVRLEAGENVV